MFNDWLFISSFLKKKSAAPIRGIVIFHEDKVQGVKGEDSMTKLNVAEV